MGSKTCEVEEKISGGKGFGLSSEILCFPILPPVIYMRHDGVGHILIVIDDDDDDVNLPPSSVLLLPPPPPPQPSLPLPPPASCSTPQPSSSTPQPPYQAPAHSQKRTRASNAQTAQKASKAPLYPQNINLYHDFFQKPPPLSQHSKPTPRSRTRNPAWADQAAQRVPVSVPLPKMQSNGSWVEYIQSLSSLSAAAPKPTNGSHNSQTQAQTNQSPQRAAESAPIPPLQYNNWVNYNIQSLQAASAEALRQTYRAHSRMDQAAQSVPLSPQRNKWSDYIQEPCRMDQAAQRVPLPPQMNKWSDYIQEPYRADRTALRPTLQPPKIEKFDYIQPSTVLPPTLRPTYRTETQAVPSQFSSTDLNARWASLTALLPHIQWYEFIKAATDAALAAVLLAPSAPIPPPQSSAPIPPPSAPTPTPTPTPTPAPAPPRWTNRAAAASSSVQTQNVSDEHQVVDKQWEQLFLKQHPLGNFQPVTELTRGRPRNHEDIKHSITYDRFSSEEYSWLPPGWYAEERTRNTGRVDTHFYHVDLERQFRSKTAVLKYLQEQMNLNNTDGGISKKRKTC